MFNSWIYNKYKIILLVVFAIIINSCKKKCSETEYYSFSNDDLSYIMISNNEINNKPIKIYKVDTVKYLLNSTDTIFAQRVRSLGQTLFSLVQCPKYMIEGEYSLTFLNNDIIINASIYQNKDDSYCGNQINRELFIKSKEDTNNYKSLFFESSCNTSNVNYSIDTTVFNNTVYSSYKFVLNSEYTSQIRNVIFIKDIGFVRFIDCNGNKIELLI